MKVFIWSDVDECTDRYHPNGAVMVIAENLERAREIAVFEPAEKYEKGEFIQMPIKPMVGVEKEPDYVFQTVSDTEKVVVFPDAGCC